MEARDVQPTTWATGVGPLVTMVRTYFLSVMEASRQEMSQAPNKNGDVLAEIPGLLVSQKVG